MRSEVAVPTPETPTPDAGGWAYTVSVRSLCEFSAKRGDLDRRFTPTATALEGIKSQQTVAARRGPDYETELGLEGSCGPLRVRGRADGYDPRRRCLEEVKTIRGHPDDIPENRRQLHWAQLRTYGALFCREREVSELTLALVYFDVTTQTEVELREVCSAEDLEASFASRCDQFLAWARQEAAHRAARDAALERLGFPQASFRAGQRDLARAVYRTAVQGGCLLAQAPTGIGKTVGTLFPLLRAMPERGIDKIAYLTCKGTGRITAMEALQGLRSGTTGRALRIVSMVSKEQACEHPDKACHGDACPLARGFYDRLPAAREQAVAEGWLDGATQRRVALRHGLCPYYLGQELARWADVLVGDVHHAFDPNGQLWGLMQAMDWRVAVLVDEAHNLVERARQMYSAQLGLQQLHDARGLAPASARASLNALLQAAAELAEGEDENLPEPYKLIAEIPEGFTRALQAAVASLGEHFQRHPKAVGPLLEFHFELQRFLKLVETLGEHSLFDLTVGPAAQAAARPSPGSGENAAIEDLFGSAPDADAAAPARNVQFCVRNVAPARFLRARFKAMHCVTLFSATLTPPEYLIQLLGLPEDTGWIDVPPAFPPAHLTVRVADGVSTRYAHRTRSLGTLVDLIAGQFEAQPGNYLAFFSSFAYLEQAATLLATRRPDLPQWRQARHMGAEARQAFLDRFAAGGRGVGFAVLGGVFSEGVDLPGSRLIGAFVATLGLPPVSPVQEQMRARLDLLFGAGHGYADLVPAMQKVVQAAGRVLRTPEDRGWLWLLDDRYLREDVLALLPPWWRIAGTARPGPSKM